MRLCMFIIVFTSANGLTVNKQRRLWRILTLMWSSHMYKFIINSLKYTICVHKHAQTFIDCVPGVAGLLSHGLGDSTAAMLMFILLMKECHIPTGKQIHEQQFRPQHKPTQLARSLLPVYVCLIWLFIFSFIYINVRL